MNNRHVATITVIGSLVILSGCAPERSATPYVPAMRYSVTGDTSPSSDARTVTGLPLARSVSAGGVIDRGAAPEYYRPVGNEGRAALRLADGDVRPGLGERRRIGDSANHLDADPAFGKQAPVVAGEGGEDNDIQVYHSTEQLPRSYTGPLPLGDPGISSSLWRESRGGNDIFRDFRAWQPMDLVTIVVAERSSGSHDADTQTKSKSTLQAAIENLVGLEQISQNWKHAPKLDETITASTKNEYEGQGQTNREAALTARISAVVAEVLPSGLLRIEGEKIISVNNEEQVMVISGLVRQRDINSNNEVNSGSIAQMRIDYYGKGIVAETQYGGWLGRILRIVWPF